MRERLDGSPSTKESGGGRVFASIVRKEIRKEGRDLTASVTKY